MLKRCKEEECLKHAASGKSMESYAARKLGYCHKHYLEHFPRRKRPNLPPARMGAERILTPHQRRLAEEAGFNPNVWSDNFRREMEEYWEARERGELSC